MKEDLMNESRELEADEEPSTEGADHLEPDASLDGPLDEIKAPVVSERPAKVSDVTPALSGWRGVAEKPVEAVKETPKVVEIKRKFAKDLAVKPVPEKGIEADFVRYQVSLTVGRDWLKSFKKKLIDEETDSSSLIKKILTVWMS